MTAPDTTIEKPYFFEGQSYELFGVAHLPTEREARGGVVFCHPFGEEKLWSHRVFVNLARRLAESGFATLRFDFMGSGDSAGQSEECTLRSFFNDIDSAVHELVRMAPGINSVALIGLRFGASLAHLYASQRTSVDRLVAWEPVLDGARYAKELLRINLTTQMAAFGKIIDDRQAIVDKMKAGEPANVDGYLISHCFYEELDSLNLLEDCETQRDIARHVIQISADVAKPYRDDIQAFASKYSNTTLGKVKAPQFWREIRLFCSNPEGLITETLRWMESKDVD